MEIEQDSDIIKEDKKIAFRQAIVNKSLIAKEVVEGKPISAVLKQLTEKKVNENVFNQNVNGNYEVEIYLTNFRFLMIFFISNEQHQEKSIFHQTIDNNSFKVTVPKMQFSDNSISQTKITYEMGQNKIQVSMVLEKLSQPDLKRIVDFQSKYKQQTPTVPLDLIVKRQILENDQSLNAQYQQIVLNRKALTEEQFWKEKEVYQNLMKLQQRDEETQSRQKQNQQNNKQLDMEQENELAKEEKKIAYRLAILNSCLTANEEVESKPISVVLRQLFEKNENDNVLNNLKGQFQAEFYLTNFRFLLIIYTKDGTYEEKSIFHQNIDSFKISIPQLTTASINYTHIVYELDSKKIQGNIFLERLSQPDEKKLVDFYTKYKEQTPTVPIEVIVKKQILEKDQKLNSFYQQVVINKKVLTEEQFWNNHEEYQNFIKYKTRDEEKIKRDYIEKEIPLIQKEFKIDVNVDPMDDRINRFDKFRKEIYDPLGQIEGQNLKSFQSYKQDVYFYGQIDSEIQRINEDKKNKNSFKKDEEINIDVAHHHHHLEIEEHSLETTHSESKKNQPQEMKKEEYQKRIAQNSEMEKQKKLEAFLSAKISSNARSQNLLKEFKEGDLKKIDPKSPDYNNLVKDAIKKSVGKIQSAWKAAFEGLYKLKPLPQSAVNSLIAKRCNEIYYEKFYQLREMLRWLYKEVNNEEKARSEVIEKLKSELEQIRNSLNEILKSLNENEKKDNADDNVKKVNLQYKERIQDLLESFIFKQSNL